MSNTINMNQPKPFLSTKLSISFNLEQWQKLQKEYDKSSDPSMSAYARKKILGKPLTLRYRNESMDDFLTQMILLRMNLEEIIQNFGPQSGLGLSPPFFSFGEAPCKPKNQRDIEELLQTTLQIREQISKISDPWLQDFVLAGR